MSDNKEIKNIADHIDRRLDEEDNKILNDYIKKEEIEQVLKEMKANKSPGEDGITTEFFIAFKEILIDEIAEMLNNIIFQGKMPNSFRNAIITLLYKNMTTEC